MFQYLLHRRSPFPFFNQSAMAQGEKKEETELHVPAKSLTLCVNNCGFAGNPATNNMCQSCFQSSGISLPPRSCSPRSTVAPILTPVQATWASEGAEDHEVEKPAATAAQTALAQGRLVNRCFACRKRVDLTGFRCRCGKLFCAEHRYSDRHDCSFDYKAAGRAAIALENPVVRPAKIVRL